MNQLTLRAAILLLAPSLLPGCAAMIARTDASSLEKYDDISQCFRDAQENPLRARCDDRFRDTVIAGEFEALKITPLGTYISLRPRTDGSHMSCWLDGPQDREQLAALRRGDRVTLRATPHGRSVTSNAVGDPYWATIEFRPCALVSVQPAPAER